MPENILAELLDEAELPENILADLLGEAELPERKRERAGLFC